MEILLILLLLAAPSVPSLAPLLSALAAIPQAAQGSQSPAPQAQTAAMQPPQNSAAPSPQNEEGPLLASLLQFFRPQEEQGEDGAPQDATGLFAQLLQLFSAPRAQGEKNAPQEAALAALLRQLTENAESTQGNACAKRPQGAAEQAVQAYKNDAEGTELSADAPFAHDRGGHAEDTFSEPAEGPLAPIRTIAPAAVRARIPPHVLTVCDGAQACGHIPVHMQEAGIDALCVAGHKGMGGIQGSGALLFSARFDPLPLLFGGSGVLSADEDMPPFYPERLEAGTLSYPAILSLAEGTLHLQLHMERESRRLLRLTRQLHAGLQEIDGLRLYSMPNPFGIAAFACPALQSELFAQRLSDEYAIAVRGGLHCAPHMHAGLGTAECGLVRASLSPANTAQEVRAFLSAVRAVAK